MHSVDPLRRRMLLGALLAPALLASCSSPRPPFRVGTNIWIGYESLYVAENEGFFGDTPIRLVTMRNASEVQQALTSGMLEAAAVSLDEALNLVEDGLDLRVVLVMDISNGADVVLGGPTVASPQELRGKRIGVETSALGAVMLQAALEAAGLQPADVEIIDMGIDRHAGAFREGRVDAVVTFEPVRSELLGEGATLLFDSSKAPGRIVDVLVATKDALARDPDAVRTLVAGHFRAIEIFRTQPVRAATIMRSRQRLAPEEILRSFAGLQIPDIAENRRMLGTAAGPPHVEVTAAKLVRIMVEHQLLGQPVTVAGLADDRFLPAP